MWTGIGFIIFLQGYRLSAPEIVNDFFRFISLDEFYLTIPLIMICFAYCFIDKKAGDYIATTLELSRLCSYFTKAIVKQPRPWILDPEVIPDNKPTSYSLPSSHASSITAAVVPFIIRYRYLPIVIPIVVLTAMIFFSRLWLGVHTPLDVITGFLLALAISFVNLKVIDWSYESEKNYYVSAIAYIIVAAVMIVIMYALGTRGEKAAMLTATMIAIFVGRIVEHRYIGFESCDANLKNKLLMFLVGSIVATVFMMMPFTTDSIVVDAIGDFLAWSFMICAMPYILKRSCTNC